MELALGLAVVNKPKYIAQRKQMMQDWADKIEQWTGCGITNEVIMN